MVSSISLANLATNQYSEVGKRMIRLSEHIKEEWLRQKRKQLKKNAKSLKLQET